MKRRTLFLILLCLNFIRGYAQSTSVFAGDGWFASEPPYGLVRWGRFTGDGGPATSASLNLFYMLDAVPMLVCDNNGNVYIADKYNGRIRKVDATGIITTVAGGGSIYPTSSGSVLGVDANFGDFYTGAITGIGIDHSGNVYFSAGNTIYKLDHITGLLDIIVRSDTYGPSGSYCGMAVSSTGDVYYPSGNVIRKCSWSGVVSIFAGTEYLDEAGTGAYGGDGNDATASTVKLNSPSSVALDPYEEYIYIG